MTRTKWSSTARRAFCAAERCGSGRLLSLRSTTRNCTGCDRISWACCRISSRNASSAGSSSRPETDLASALAKSVSGRDELPADEALRLLILQHAQLILSHPVQFRVVERSESSLPEPHRSAAQNARRAVLDHFVRVIQRGIDGGQFRRGTDARIAAFSIIGMCNWSAWWFDPRGNTPADEIASTIV